LDAAAAAGMAESHTGDAGRGSRRYHIRFYLVKIPVAVLRLVLNVTDMVKTDVKFFLGGTYEFGILNYRWLYLFSAAQRILR
jgi:hypothetical protein